MLIAIARIDDALPPDTNAVMQWPEDLLITLQEEDIALSMPVKEYIFAGICAWRHQPLPIATAHRHSAAPLTAPSSLSLNTTLADVLNVARSHHRISRAMFRDNTWPCN